MDNLKLLVLYILTKLKFVAYNLQYMMVSYGIIHIHWSTLIEANDIIKHQKIAFILK